MVSAEWRSAGRTAAVLVLTTAFVGCHKLESGTGSVLLAATLSGPPPSAVDQVTVTIAPKGISLLRRGPESS